MTTLDDPPRASRGFLASANRVLASPWFGLAAVAIALLLTHRAVYNGLDADDFFHWAVLNGSERYEGKLPGPQGMFRFLNGDPEQARELMDIGFLPWWSDPYIKAEFSYLIPTQTHILDYWLWPDQPALMHVHSLVWFALLIFLAARFYRRTLGATWMAGVAVLLFAIEDGHGFPAGWVANRNILIAVCFGIGCMMAHDAWRREKRNWALWLALSLWALSLCSKEAGIATCAYLFAYALWLDESTLRQRFMTLVPYGVVLIVWRVVRDLLGYGVEHVGYYVDPITEPGRFLLALVERYPVLLLGQWGIPADIWCILGERFRSPYWWGVVGCVCILGGIFWPVLRRDRVARYFATGMLLAVIPICATMPSDRLLMFVGLGAFGLLVRFWWATFSADGPRSAFVLWRVVAVPIAVLLILAHVVVAPLFLPMRTDPFGGVQRLYVRVPFDRSIEEQDLVIVNAPVPFFVIYCQFNYEHDGLPCPRGVRALAPGMGPVVVKRTDDRTLEVRPRDGYLNFPDRLFRNEYRPLHVGEEVRLARMSATVLAVEEDGRPSKVAFCFSKFLEDNSLRWLHFHKGEYVPWTPPAVGEEIVLESGWNPFAKD